MNITKIARQKVNAAIADGGVVNAREFAISVIDAYPDEADAWKDAAMLRALSSIIRTYCKELENSEAPLLPGLLLPRAVMVGNETYKGCASLSLSELDDALVLLENHIGECQARFRVLQELRRECRERGGKDEDIVRNILSMCSA